MPPSTKRKAGGPSSEELRKVRDRELELKRISGEISCSDCRRLKLKCDKKIPCSSCIRRGAEALCPLGAGRGHNGQNSRMALTTSSHYYTQRLSRKLTLLSERVRALEDALALESEARGGSGFHPLLSEGQLAIKQCIDDDDNDVSEEEEEGGEELLSAFGTLSIGESRTERYLGPIASESALLMEIFENVPHNYPAITTGTSSDSLSSEIIQSSKYFPFAPALLAPSEHSLLVQIVTHLPPFERATALYEAFFRNLSWFIAPIERTQFVSEIIPLFYPRRKPIIPVNVRDEHGHDLALLFVLFACGSVGDLTQNPINEEAQRYYTLAKAALSVKSVMHGASLAAVQTLYLLGSYDVYSGGKSHQEDAWKVVGLGSTMALAIGLHRDPSRWGFEPKIVDRRRRVFWEIYSIDVYRSLETGRPATFRPSVVDCEFPNDQYAKLDENGEVIESIANWRYRFLRDIASEICDKVCSSRPLKYRYVLELDRRIRDFAPHPYAIRQEPRDNDSGIDQDFHRIYPLITIWDKEESLMYIHRNFFARAILDFPDNPMRSPFAASFLTTYRSASAVLRLCRENMEYMYLIVLRIWQVWSLCLACGVIVGAVASLGSSVSFATSAFVDVEYAIALFEKYGGHKVAKHGLPLLRRIREKAINALRQPRIRQSSPDDNTKNNAIIPTIRNASEDMDEELLILRGTTRVVEHRSAQSPVRPAALAASTDVGRAASETTMQVTEGTLAHSDTHFPVNGNAAQPAESIFVKGSPESVTQDNISRQSTVSLQTPGSVTWLAELEQLFGSSASIPHLHAEASNQQQGQGFEWSNNYPEPSATMPGMMPSASIPHAQGDFSGASSRIPDTYLEQAVSTEDWRAFMQQSGFTNSPPFDFSIDSAASTPPNIGQYWRTESPMYT